MNVSKNKLIVALDVESAEKAWYLVHALRGVVGMFKIGSQLFTAAGPSLVREIVDLGEEIFLDLKFHDIPNTVAAAGVEAARLGVSIFNLHAAGGSEMMRRTVGAVAEISEAEGLKRPTIIAVTLLTSADARTLRELDFSVEPEQLVGRLAALAESSGLDGVVASPHEVGVVRSAVKRDDFMVVTPGVRPTGGAWHDQKRVMTPREAIAAGADYVVVGRPIVGADNPEQAARAIVEEMNAVATGAS